MREKLVSRTLSCMHACYTSDSLTDQGLELAEGSFHIRGVALDRVSLICSPRRNTMGMSWHGLEIRSHSIT